MLNLISRSAGLFALSLLCTLAARGQQGRAPATKVVVPNEGVYRPYLVKAVNQEFFNIDILPVSPNTVDHESTSMAFGGRFFGEAYPARYIYLLY